MLDTDELIETGTDTSHHDKSRLMPVDRECRVCS
jgi:hypothetical protein